MGAVADLAERRYPAAAFLPVTNQGVEEKEDETLGWHSFERAGQLNGLPRANA